MVVRFEIVKYSQQVDIMSLFYDDDGAGWIKIRNENTLVVVFVLYHMLLLF